MPAATVLPPRKRPTTKVNALILALVLGGGGLAVVGAAEMAGAAPAKKPCAGKSCKSATSTTASPAPTPTETTEAAPAPAPTSATPTAEPTKEPTAEPSPTAEPTKEPTADPTSSPTGDTSGTWVSPEGVTISVAPDAQGWTPKAIYDVLSANAFQLALVGPALKIVVSGSGGNSTASGAGSSGGTYTSFKATMYLSTAENSSLNVNPDRLIAHEYGHVWTLYHLYLTHNKDWSTYLDYRGLLGDSRLDSTYLWDRRELIADDFRLLFGSSEAVAGGAYLNRDLTDPRQVPGLKEFLVRTWAQA